MLCVLSSSEVCCAGVVTMDINRRPVACAPVPCTHPSPRPSRLARGCCSFLMAAAVLQRRAAMLRGPSTVSGAAWMGRVAQVLKVQDNAMAMLQLRSPSLGSEAVRIMRQEVDESQEDERVHSMAIRPAAPCIAGSDVAALHADTAESRSDHFDSIAHLCRELGESKVRGPNR